MRLSFANVLIILVLVSFLSACTKTKEYRKVFIGESEHWIGELVQNGKISIKNHEELENQYEIIYEKFNHLTIKFKGNTTELGERVEFFNKDIGCTEYGPSGINGEWTTKEFTSTNGQSSTTHIPKDMTFNPYYKESDVIKVNVNWGNGKGETIQLSYDK